MNKIVIFFAFAFFILLVNDGVSIKAHADSLKSEYLKLVQNNLKMKEEVQNKKMLIKRPPLWLSAEYGVVMNQVKSIENSSGTSMNVQLEGVKDAEDITSHFVSTAYKGVKGLRVRIVIDKFSQEADMGAMLDDIHLLEKTTDFMALEISKNNNNLVVKGEIYGL